MGSSPYSVEGTHGPHMRFLLSIVSSLALAGYVLGNINEGLSAAAVDGEVAMKNLEAAQVKMEQKLESMTNFIDKGLQKAKDSPVVERYSRKKRSPEEDPLMQLPEEKVKEIIINMNTLNAAFEELKESYLMHKNMNAQDVASMDANEAMGEGTAADQTESMDTEASAYQLEA